MIYVAALLLLGTASDAIEAKTGSPVPVTSNADQELLNRFIAALLLKDETVVGSLTEPQVHVEPAIDSRPGLRDTTISGVMEATRSCDFGGALRNYSSQPGYVINWWCSYASYNGQVYPSDGASVLIGVEKGKVRLRNFSYGQRYGPAPRISSP